MSELRMCSDLARWWPLLSPLSHYVEEATGGPRIQAAYSAGWRPTMQLHALSRVAFVLVLAACGDPAGSGAQSSTEPAPADPQAAAPPSADAASPPPAPAEPTPPDASQAAADAAAILGALGLTLDAQGQIANECGEQVTPQILPAELGGSVGTARLVAIGGGPNMAACYGDGPDLHLMLRDGAGYREIYAARGRMLILLTTARNGVRDIADGGPGFSFPVWEWNGNAYASAGRSIADSELGGATFLP